MEGDLLIGRWLVGGEDPADDVSPGRRAANVRKLVIAEGVDGPVEVGGSPRGKAPEEDSAAPMEELLEPALVGSYGVGEPTEVELNRGVWGHDGRKNDPADGLLVENSSLHEQLFVRH